ncbi:hypothetical protein Avbf_18072 [Armadillidium vulgare]|nr:hypothetical protein Avbf_18072 [Armadillidium vulgare]
MVAKMKMIIKFKQIELLRLYAFSNLLYELVKCWLKDSHDFTIISSLFIWLRENEGNSSDVMYCLLLCTTARNFVAQGRRMHRSRVCEISYLTVDQGLKAAKEDLVSLWENEDKVGNPSYRDFSPQTKNIKIGF